MRPFFLRSFHENIEKIDLKINSLIFPLHQSKIKSNFMDYKDKKYSKIEEFPKTKSFENFINEICKKCSFKYPYIYPHDGKIIEEVNASEYSFLVTILSLNGEGARVDFVRL